MASEQKLKDAYLSYYEQARDSGATPITWAKWLEKNKKAYKKLYRKNNTTATVGTADKVLRDNSLSADELASFVE